MMIGIAARLVTVHVALPNDTIIFVAGTDTGVGKTIVAAALVRRLRALGHAAIGVKPVETGCAHGDDQDLVGADGEILHRAAHRAAPPLVVSPYRFLPPVAPAVAAERAGIELGLDDLSQAVRAALPFGQTIVVEGAGGALSPVSHDGLGLDLAERIGASVLIVARDDLGAQSQTLLVLEALRRRALRIAGVILSRCRPPEPWNPMLASGAPATSPSALDLDLLENARLIRERGGARVFPTIAWIEGDESHRIAVVEAHFAAHEIAEAVLESSHSP